MAQNNNNNNSNSNDPKLPPALPVSCPECWAPLELTDKVVLMNCGHVFHEDCVKYMWSSLKDKKAGNSAAGREGMANPTNICNACGSQLMREGIKLFVNDDGTSGAAREKTKKIQAEVLEKSEKLAALKSDSQSRLRSMAHLSDRKDLLLKILTEHAEREGLELARDRKGNVTGLKFWEEALGKNGLLDGQAAGVVAAAAAQDIKDPKKKLKAAKNAANFHFPIPNSCLVSDEELKEIKKMTEPQLREFLRNTAKQNKQTSERVAKLREEQARLKDLIARDNAEAERLNAKLGEYKASHLVKKGTTGGAVDGALAESGGGEPTNTVTTRQKRPRDLVVVEEIISDDDDDEVETGGNRMLQQSSSTTTTTGGGGGAIRTRQQWQKQQQDSDVIDLDGDDDEDIDIFGEIPSFSSTTAGGNELPFLGAAGGLGVRTLSTTEKAKAELAKAKQNKKRSLMDLPKPADARFQVGLEELPGSHQKNNDQPKR